MADGDMTKIGIAAALAASVGGVGGHQIGSGSEPPTVNSVTIEQCEPFILHAARHERAECDIRALKVNQD